MDAPPVPLERLEAQICELAGNLAAAEARFLTLVGEFDARSGWASWDLPSCSAWLAWKCQVAPGTAREQVRVARALRDLPVLSAEFAAGRLSYAKVRALTRIATPATEAGLADIAGPMTAAQLERFAAAHRTASDADELRVLATRRVRVKVEDDGQVRLSVRLPAVDGAVVLQALRAAAGDVEHPHGPHPDGAKDPGQADVSAETSGKPTRLAAGSFADALVEVAQAYLSRKVAAASDPGIYQVVVHVGQEALTSAPTPEAASRVDWHPASPIRCHLDDGPAIAPAAAAAIACRASLTWMLHDHDGSLIDVGRRHRRATPALRRAVRERDNGRCRFPGCNSRRTDVHHIIAWAQGGKTKLPNLISLCEAHHVIVHALGYLIKPAADARFLFTRPDGRHVPDCPGLPGGDGDLDNWHDAIVTAETIVPAGLADTFDLDLALWACLANARIAEQRSSGEGDGASGHDALRTDDFDIPDRVVYMVDTRADLCAADDRL
jgi:5-methylcytosine-specific restriction endonuclease McrA